MIPSLASSASYWEVAGIYLHTAFPLTIPDGIASR